MRYCHLRHLRNYKDQDLDRADTLIGQVNVLPITWRADRRAERIRIKVCQIVELKIDLLLRHWLTLFMLKIQANKFIVAYEAR